MSEQLKQMPTLFQKSRVLRLRLKPKIDDLLKTPKVFRNRNKVLIPRSRTINCNQILTVILKTLMRYNTAFTIKRTELLKYIRNMSQEPRNILLNLFILTQKSINLRTTNIRMGMTIVIIRVSGLKLLNITKRRRTMIK